MNKVVPCRLLEPDGECGLHEAHGGRCLDITNTIPICVGDTFAHKEAPQFIVVVSKVGETLFAGTQTTTFGLTRADLIRDFVRVTNPTQPLYVKSLSDQGTDRADTVGGSVALLVEAVLALRLAPGDAGAIFTRFMEKGIKLDAKGRETLLAAAFVLGVEVGRPRLSHEMRQAVQEIVGKMREGR